MTMVAILVCANFTSCSDDDDDSTLDGGSKIPTNTIYYETTDKIELRLKNEDVFGGAELKNNTYSTTNGYGILEFDSEVTAIESGAFENEKTLSSITLPNSVVTIEDFAFGYCSNLESAILGNRVEKIGYSAFDACNLTSINIPSSVTKIGEGAFQRNNNLTQIHISDITAWCKLNFDYGAVNPLYFAQNLYLNGKLATDLVIPGNVKEIKNYAFYYCRSLTSVTIPNSVTTIGNGAFSHCTSLTSITIPNGVTTIGEMAFTDCSGLTSITIGDGVTTIGEWAFYGCTGLTNLTIGNGVTKIGHQAFGSSNIESIYVKSKTPAELWLSFNDYTLQNATLYVPKGSLDTYKNAYEWQEFENIKEF